jgi:hypothetical protein
MRTKAVGFAVVGLVVAIALVVGWRARSARQAFERERAGLVARQAAREAELREWTGRLAASERIRAELSNAVEKTRTPAVPPSRVTTENKRVVGMPTNEELIRANPKLEALYLRHFRFIGERDVGAFLKDMRFSPEQIRAFGDIWLRKVERSTDLKAAAALQDAAGKETVARLEKEASEEFKRSMAELLGTEGYKAWEDFTRLNLARMSVASLAGIAAIDGAPIGREQVEQLTRVLADAGVGRENRRPRGAPSVDWAAIDAKAAQILTPAQWALFRSVNTGAYTTRWNIAVDDAIWRAQQSESANTSVKISGGK